jgi:hypothetical protein
MPVITYSSSLSKVTGALCFFESLPRLHALLHNVSVPSTEDFDIAFIPAKAQMKVLFEAVCSRIAGISPCPIRSKLPLSAHESLLSGPKGYFQMHPNFGSCRFRDYSAGDIRVL